MPNDNPLQPPMDLIDQDDLKGWIEQVIDHPLNRVRVNSLTSTDSASGVPLFRIEAQSDVDVHRFVVKIASPNGDWIARATHDDTVREAALVRAGLRDLLPPEIQWPVLATRPLPDNAWMILMNDVSSLPGARLVPSGDETVSAEETTRHLVNLAALHRAFLDKRSELADVSLCSIGDWVTMLGPTTIERERDGDDPVTPHLERGWEMFCRIAPRKVASAVGWMLEDPKYVVEALSKGPMTLLHGDFKFGNLGLQDGDPPATIALDWSQAMWGPPQLDLGWFLAVNSARLPFDKSDAISIYREALGVTENYDWYLDVDLAQFAGGVLRLGWAKALGAMSDDADVQQRERKELDWWLLVAESALLNNLELI